MCQLNVMYNLLTCIFLIKNYLGSARNVIYKLDCTAIMILNRFSCRYCVFVYYVRFYICWRTYSNNSRKCKKENGYRRNYFAHTHTCKSLICHTDGNISLHVSAQLDLFLPPANEVCEGYVFTCVCQSFCSQGGCAWPGGHAWRGACLGGHVWLGGMHGEGGIHGWGGMHGQGGVCAMHAPPAWYYEIWSVYERVVRILLECILVFN